MKDIRNILLALDFTERSDGAAEYALTLSGLTGAHLHVLHVMSELEERQRVMIPAEAFKTLQKEVELQTIKELKAFCSKVATDVPTTSYARIGVPFRVIIDTAREINADLIVMGTHGQSSLEHVLVGSTAERVVRRSEIAVLTVRG